MSVNQIVDLLYKNAQGVASTTDDRSIKQENLASNKPLYDNQIWMGASLIPLSGPSLDIVMALPDNGVFGRGLMVIRRLINLQLLPTNSANSFQHASLINAIPARFGGGFQYQYVVGGLNGVALGPTYLDNAAGILRVFNPVLSTPPTISLWRYEGIVGIQNNTIGPVQYISKVGLKSSMTVPQGFAAIDAVLNTIVPIPPPTITSVSLVAIAPPIAAYLSGDATTQIQLYASPFTAVTVSPYLDIDNSVSLVIDTSTSAAIQPIIGATTAVSNATLTITANDINLVSMSVTNINPVPGTTPNTIALRSTTDTSPPYSYYICGDVPPITNKCAFGNVSVLGSVPVSGITLWGAGTIINVNVNVALCGAFYRAGTLLTAAGPAVIIVFPVTTPVNNSNGVVSDYLVQLRVLTNTYIEAANIKVSTFNALGVERIVAINTPYRVDTASIQTIIAFNRVNSGVGMAPTIYGGLYDNTISLLNNEELQILGGVVRWPLNINYSTPQLPNPDYSGLDNVATTAGYRWFTTLFNGVRSSVGNSNSGQLEPGYNLLTVRLYKFLGVAVTTNLAIYGISMQLSFGANSPWIDFNMASQLDASNQNGLLGSTLYRSVNVGNRTQQLPCNVYIRIGLPLSSNISFSSITCDQS